MRLGADGTSQRLSALLCCVIAERPWSFFQQNPLSHLDSAGVEKSQNRGLRNAGSSFSNLRMEVKSRDNWTSAAEGGDRPRVDGIVVAGLAGIGMFSKFGREQ